jgi:hypothetical protein
MYCSVVSQHETTKNNVYGVVCVGVIVGVFVLVGVTVGVTVGV